MPATASTGLRDWQPGAYVTDGVHLFEIEVRDDVKGHLRVRNCRNDLERYPRISEVAAALDRADGTWRLVKLAPEFQIESD